LALSSTVELQKQREQLARQEKSLREQLVRDKGTLKKAISASGYTVFLGESLQQFQTIIEELRQQGKFPTGIKQQFVQQLLEQQKCICGTQLAASSQAYQMVKSWLDRAGSAEVEEAAIRLENQVQQLEKQVPKFWQGVDEQQEKLEQARTEVGKIDDQLYEIGKKLRTSPDEDIKKLQQNLEAIEQAIKDLTLEQGRNQQSLAQISKEVNSKNKQITKQKLKEEKQLLAQRRIKIAEEAMERVVEVRKRLENQFRLSLEQRVYEIFSSISFTPYVPRLNPNYELSLLEKTSGVMRPVAASTGENQILSLAFIGGIIDRVREWSQQDTLMGLDSSTFPIVMDSPFGSLDEIYRRQVAKAIPGIANQLVVLVTKTQWRGEVEQEMHDYLGQEYVLVYHSPKPDCQEDEITRGGKVYPLVKRSADEFEYTEILAVESY
ncbi:MAG: ATP-binding protein, partial [Okeania sp. SIO2D1]|nr:ATP-binding protein [Okeania sp. SIO2D1]